MTENTKIKERTCPHCGGHNVMKSGTGWKGKNRYVCKDDWRTFYLEDTIETKEIK